MLSILQWGTMDWIRFVFILTNLINMKFVTNELFRNTKLFLLNKKITKTCIEYSLIEDFNSLLEMRIMHIKAITLNVAMFFMIIWCIFLILV